MKKIWMIVCATMCLWSCRSSEKQNLLDALSEINQTQKATAERVWGASASIQAHFQEVYQSDKEGTRPLKEKADKVHQMAVEIIENLENDTLSKKVAGIRTFQDFLVHCLALIPEEDREWFSEITQDISSMPQFTEEEFMLQGMDSIVISSTINNVWFVAEQTHRYLYSQLNDPYFNPTQLEAVVNAKSNIVKKGDDYEAEVFLVAYDSTDVPDIILEDGTRLPTKNGKGIYRVRADSTGTFTQKGVLQARNKVTHMLMPYEFEIKYRVTDSDCE